MNKFFKKLKAGLEEAIAYEKGNLDLRSEIIEVSEPRHRFRVGLPAVLEE